MELVITEVQGGVDWLEWLEVDVHFLFFSLLGNNGTTIYDLKITIIGIWTTEIQS